MISSLDISTAFLQGWTFQDMEKAAGLLLDAIAENRRVVVFADYDVDGGTSSALLARYFRHWGREMGLYVPDRLLEGYGPSPEAFRHLKEQGADLVVTVDCGAAATAALEEARRIALPVIVVDHHLMGTALPETTALVNPNRADDTSGYGHLAAAGVVFVLLAAMNKVARERGIAPEGGLPDILQWLDLCALGTLCDMSPLQDANRAFVRQGLKIMARGQNPGLRALADIAGIGTVESVYHATFMLGPRLNAGGRVGDPTVAGRVADRLRDCISATRASRSAAAASTRARKDLAAFPPERPARKPSVAAKPSVGCGNIDAGAVAGRAGHATRGSTGRRGRCEVRGLANSLSTGSGAVKKAPSPYISCWRRAEEKASSSRRSSSEIGTFSAGGGAAGFDTTVPPTDASLERTISPKLPSTSLKPWRS